MTIVVWLILLLLICVNALYVAAEFAAVGVRRSRIRQLAQDGNWMARMLVPVLDDPSSLDRYIAACQIGITISSLVLGAFGQATLTDVFAPLFASIGGLQPVAAHSTSAVVVLLFLTVLQMVLGELVPKSLALQYPTRIALLTALPMRWSLTALSWFIAVLNGSGNLILRIIGAPLGGHRHIHSPEEIDLIIAESRHGGLLDPGEERRLHRALQLAVRPAHQLMVPRRYIRGISIDSPPAELLKIVTEGSYTRLPVYEGSIDHIVGLLHAKDVLTYYLEQKRVPTAGEVMRPMAMFSEFVNADRLISLMRKRRARQAIMVDEFGGVAGLVTVENILTDVIGRVPGRGGRLHARAERLPDGRVRLPGMMRLHEAETWLGSPLYGDADTVGGLIVSLHGGVPATGERVKVDGIEMEVELVTDRLITSVLVSLPPDEHSGEEVKP